MTGTSIIMYPWVHNVDLIHPQSKVKKIFDQYILMIILQLKMLEAKQNVAAFKHLQNPSDKILSHDFFANDLCFDTEDIR